MKEILHEAMEYLASVCDGAKEHDGAGFSKPDSYNGKYLASKAEWDEDETLLACHYAKKYSGQLTHLSELLYETIDELTYGKKDDRVYAEAVTYNRRKAFGKQDKPNYAEMQGDKIVVVTPYNENFLADGKKIASRRWDGANKATTFSTQDIKAVVALCDKYGIEVKFDINFKPEPVAAPAPAPVKVKREVFVEKGKIIITFPYDRELVALVKNSGLARWDADKKHWYADIAYAEAVTDTLAPNGFTIDPALKQAVYQGVKNAEEYNLADTDWRAEVPQIREGLAVLPHQWVAIQKALETNNMLNADSQGLGKTFASLTTLVIKGSKHNLVVAPSSLTANWEKEAHMFFEDGTFTVFHAEGRTPKEIPEDANLVIIGWPNLAFWMEAFEKWGLDAIVVDEAHYGKSGKKSKRGEAYVELGKKYKDALKIALTGTPILNRPLELLPILVFFGIINKFGGITKFKNRYCGPKRVDTPYGTTFTYNGAENLDELHSILTASGTYLRRTKKLLMDQGLLKKKYVNKVEFFEYETPRTPTFVALNAEERTKYDNIEKDFKEKLNEVRNQVARDMGLHPNHPLVVNAVGSNKAGMALAVLTEYRKQIGLLKIRAIKEHVQNLIAKGERVVLFAHHREVVDAYANEFGGLKIQGGMGTKKIEEAKAKFNGLPIEQAPVIVVSIEAGKTGHTLCLQAKNGVGQECRHAIFAEEPYVYGDAEQAEDRIYRIGQSRDVYIDNLMVRGTVDERIYSIRESKRAVFNALIDGVNLGDTDEEETNAAKEILKGYLK